MTTQPLPLASQAPPPQFDLTTAVKDPDFLKAPTHEKIAFLSAHDPDFAAAHPNDQGAYLAHLLGSDQPTQFEKDRPGEGISLKGSGGAFWDSVKNMAGSLWQGAKASKFGFGDTRTTQQYLQDERARQQQQESEDQARKAAGYGTGYRVAAAAGSSVGMDPASAERHAARGEGEAIIGEALAPLATLAAGEIAKPLAKPLSRVAGKAAGAVGDAAATVLRNEEGKLRPSVRAVSRGVGALAGHATGMPGMEVVGAFGAPSVVDALTPAREPTVAKAVPITQSPYYAENQAKIATAKAAEAEARKAVPLSRSPYYEQNQAKLAEEKAAQTAAADEDAEARKAVPVTQSPYYAQNRAKAAAEAKAAKVAPVISRPGPDGPRFTGNEGRPATWTNERVMQLAREGNREAIQQAVRRGMELPPNARYVAGDADFSSGTYNPRDVTTFGPDGTPIRQGGSRVVPAPTDRFFKTVFGEREVPNVEVVGESTGPRANASGEPGGGGLEEMSRQASEKEAGVKYFREKSGGERVPLIGLGRQDLRPAAGERIIRVDANGLETVLDAQPARPLSGHLIRKKPQ